MVGDDKTNDDKPKDTCDMKASDASSPYYLHPSDHPGINICQVVLKCENFQEWERCMRNAFRAKRKLGFLEGIITKPDDKSLEIKEWGRYNDNIASSDDSNERGSDIVNDTNDVRYATNKSQENTGGHRRSSRERQPSVLLRHFVCHTIQSLDPIQSCAPPNDSSSSGTRYHLANFVTYNKFSTAHTQFLAAVTIGNERTRFSQVITDPNWRDAMHKEIDALEKNGTWVLEDLPHGKKAIGCKWVYKIKYHSDGTIERYKARLVILGNNQWELHQMDVHNAFLHGDLDEEVYMKLPPGFYGSRGKVCRLKNGIELHVLVYVDDLIVAGNNSDAIAKFRAYMSTCFHMKDLGALKYFLGIEIARHPEGIFLSQRKYALDILSESDLLGAKPCDFPIEPNHQLALASGPDFNQPDRYRCLVGRLFYLTFTRPELCYSIHTLAQFMQSPKDTDICLIVY
ncbi:retrovirus-related pol polyprotein from transposon TNT 1-94 [Tanacetum coccineum]